VFSIQQAKDGEFIAAGNESIERKDYKGDKDYKKTSFIF
jgi:hypothetical protein